MTKEELAVHRTKLANERTLLSYIRTSLVFFAGGATLLKIASGDVFFMTVAWLLLASGTVLAILGLYLFRKNRRVLNFIPQKNH